MSAVTLAATLHDPSDGQLDQSLRVLPLLKELYGAIVVRASGTTSSRSINVLRERGVIVEQVEEDDTLATLGRVRLATVAQALETAEQTIHLCDWDRIIHWAEAWPEELRQVVTLLPSVDFLILGRTARAFASHPQVQRDTEALINHAFHLAWGQPLDIGAAARSLSPRAAACLLAGCDEPTIGNDGAWPLFLARHPDLTIGYAATEGLEWETADRHASEIALMGGLDAWVAAFDADLDHWVTRLELARIEVDAIRRWRRVPAAVSS